MTEPVKSGDISGWLWIWSNDVRMYEKMWFVLSNGVLAHYANQEVTTGTGQGRLSLAGAVIDFDDTCKFVICQDVEAYHIKTDNQEDKQRWIEALLSPCNGCREVEKPCTDSSDTSTRNRPEPSETARATACTDDRTFQKPEASSTKNGGQSQEDDPYSAETSPPASEMSAQSESQSSNSTCSEVMKNLFDTAQFTTIISIMKRKLKDVQTSNGLIGRCKVDLQQLFAAIENCQENGMFLCVSEKIAEYQAAANKMTEACTSYLKLAESFSRKYISLCDSEYERRIKMEQVVRSLTREQSELSGTVSEDDENTDYFECCETANSEEGYTNVTVQVYQAVAGGPGTSRRTRIPDRPNVSDSLWSVLKNCIGSDLSKMPLPVSFSEPLSLLQRLTEDLEYASVLDRASECSDVATQLAYVAAFISSSYSTTIGRIGKPFNPLLGETYECDRQSDLGWRSIAEQVSHHPPVAAIHGEGKNWKFWMDQSMKSKFKGTTLTVVPLGECHLNFKNGHRYSWHKPNTSIHNVIVGKLWVEQEGDVDIKCATSKVSCKLTFISSGWTVESFSLKGIIKDETDKPVFDIIGKYSSHIEYRPSGSKDPGTVVWKRTEPPADCGKYYNFTLLACQLNEMENGVAPTDSRFRPDQRLMEEGNFDAASVMKKKLEEFQRANKKETWTPCWFKRQPDPDTKTEIWTFTGEYWPCKTKKNWSRCPTYIFSPP